MLGIRWKQVKFVIDLSKPDCHVCGRRLVRNMTTKKEFCVNPGCQVRGVKFNIPYKPEERG